MNPELWGGDQLRPSEALRELVKWTSNLEPTDEGFEVGKPNAKKTPQYANRIRAGDILLLYAGNKFDKPGVYGIARAGTQQQEARHDLAVSRGTWRLPFRWLSYSKQLARRPFQGHGNEFAPPGPASTLLELKKPSAAVLNLVRTALGSTTLDSTGDAVSFEDLPEKDRESVKQEIQRLIRDRRLRPLVLQVWGPACIACGMSLRGLTGIPECQAAHILSVGEGGPDRVRNALPLCRTHHWAYDEKLWAIHPSDLTIRVPKAYRAHPVLGKLHGKRIQKPDGPDRRPARELLSRDHLDTRWKEFLRATRELRCR